MAPVKSSSGSKSKAADKNGKSDQGKAGKKSPKLASKVLPPKSSGTAKRTAKPKARAKK